MVYHFSSKLSHLAQSFRPQHHLNSLRSAFPSSTTTTTFTPNSAFTSNPPPNNQNSNKQKFHPERHWSHQSPSPVIRTIDEEPSSRSRSDYSLRSASLLATNSSLPSPDRFPQHLQKRFKSAFSHGPSRIEDELVGEGNEAIVERKVIGNSVAPRRASISRSIQKRSLSTRSHSPPSPDIPRHRRNSTSAIPTPSSFSTDPPVSRPSPTRKPSESSSDYGLNPGQFPSPNAYSRFQSLQNARRTLSYPRVQDAVRQYLAVESDFNVQTHHLAMESLLATRPPYSEITKIVDLYNQMFDHKNLSPTNRTYELIISTFCARDREVRSNLKFLKLRNTKVDITIAARGPWHVEANQVLSNETERAIEKLNREDYFTPALKIYIALGPGADGLKAHAINALLSSAVDHNRVDLALSIFERLERSPENKLSAKTFETLMKMFTNEKDLQGALEVFEAFLAARAAGTLPPPSREGNRGTSAVFDRTATKARFDSRPSQTLREAKADTSVFFAQGDERLWRAAIVAHFAVGDSLGAVALMERAVTAIEAPTGPPPGYPSAISPYSITAIVAGFANAHDPESALNWFRQGMALIPPNATESAPFLSISFLAASDANELDLMNDIFFTWIAAFAESKSINITDYMLALDRNIGAAYAAQENPARANQLVENVLRIQAACLDAIKRGTLVEQVGADFNLSSGITSRISKLLAYFGRYHEANDVFVQSVQDVRKTGVLAPTALAGTFRTPEQWVISLTNDNLYAVIGLVPAPGAAHRSEAFQHRTNERPPLAVVASALLLSKQLRATTSTYIDFYPIVYNTLIESYLLEKAAVGGDVAKLGLSGEQWLLLIEAVALYAVNPRSPNLLLPVPSFPSILDDFASADTPLPARVDFAFLLDTLRRGRYSNSELKAVLSTLSPVIAHASAENSAYSIPDLLALHAPPAPSPELEAIDLSPSPSEAFRAVTPTDPVSALASAQRSLVALPTPPALVPDYFASLPPISIPKLTSVSIKISPQIDELTVTAPLLAYSSVLASVEQGIYPHSDSLGRLVEALGRLGKLQEVYHVYLLAYEALLKLEGSTPEARSISWIVLEDHMVIALCQVGALEHVAVHRNRLLEGGSAPSADGYAAMILNMKETTDDAAVALELFEESQRLSVAPNVYLFNTLISKLSRARRAPDAVEYFEYMKSIGLRPSAITYGAIINACCKTGDDTTADYLFVEMVNSPGFKPRVPPYNTMIQFFTHTKPDRERALYYYDALVKAGVAPTAHTYKLLLDVYGSIEPVDLDSMGAAFGLLQADPNVPIGAPHWASVINAWGCVQRDLETATSIFNSIASHPSAAGNGRAGATTLPDATVYESLLNACLANQRADLCERYLLEMKERGVRMTAYIINTLIKGYASQGNLEAARLAFESMVDPPAGVAAAHNHPIDRHAKQHGGASALPLPGANDPIYREPSSWETMIRTELAAGEHVKAGILLHRMEERAFPEAVVKKIRALLEGLGVESLPMAAS